MQMNYETFFLVTISFYEILMNFVLIYFYSNFYLAYLRNIYVSGIYIKYICILKYAYMPYIKFIYFLITFENKIYNFLICIIF